MTCLSFSLSSPHLTLPPLNSPHLISTHQELSRSCIPIRPASSWTRATCIRSAGRRASPRTLPPGAGRARRASWPRAGRRAGWRRPRPPGVTGATRSGANCRRPSRYDTVVDSRTLTIVRRHQVAVMGKENSLLSHALGHAPLIMPNFAASFSQ